MSDTPRTDEFYYERHNRPSDGAWLKYARQLERELVALPAKLAEAERWKEEYRDRLTFEEQETKKAEQRAERAEALADERIRAAVAAERERWVKKAESMMPERGPIRATLTDLVAAIREGTK